MSDRTSSQVSDPHCTLTWDDCCSGSCLLTHIILHLMNGGESSRSLPHQAPGCKFTFISLKIFLFWNGLTEILLNCWQYMIVDDWLIDWLMFSYCISPAVSHCPVFSHSILTADLVFYFPPHFLSSPSLFHFTSSYLLLAHPALYHVSHLIRVIILPPDAEIFMPPNRNLAFNKHENGPDLRCPQKHPPHYSRV